MCVRDGGGGGVDERKTGRDCFRCAELPSTANVGEEIEGLEHLGERRGDCAIQNEHGAESNVECCAWQSLEE